MTAVKQKFVLAAKILLGGACLAWALSAVPGSTWRLAFAHLDWLWVMLAAWIGNQVFCALRLRVLLSIFGYHVSVVDAFRVGFAGFFLSSILPGVVVGDVAKIALLRYATRNTGVGELTMVTLLDRAFGVLSLWFVSFVLSFFIHLPDTFAAQTLLWMVRLSVIGPVVAIAVLLFIANPRSEWLTRSLTGRAAHLANRARSIVRKLLRRESLIAIVTGVIPLSLLAVLCLVVAQDETGALVALSLSEPASVLTQAFLAPTSIFVSTIPIAPAGMGVGQVTLASLYGVAGLSPQIAVLLTTMVQISQLLVGCTIGAACFMLVRRRARQVESHAS